MGNFHEFQKGHRDGIGLVSGGIIGLSIWMRRVVSLGTTVNLEAKFRGEQALARVGKIRK